MQMREISGLGGNCQTFGFQSSSESCSLFVRSCLLLTAHLTRSHFCAVAQQPKKRNQNIQNLSQRCLASQIPHPAILPTTQSTTMDLVSVAMMAVALRKVVDGDCRLSEASSLWKLAARRPCWAPPAHRPPLHHPSSPSCNTTPTLTFFQIVVYCFPRSTIATLSKAIQINALPLLTKLTSPKVTQPQVSQNFLKSQNLSSTL